MPESNEQTLLYAALANAIADAGAVEKSSRNEHHKYAYASADTIYAEGRAALAKHGLALIPQAYTCAPSETPGVNGWLERVYLLTHKGGGNITLATNRWPVIVGNGRPLDKALSAALTTSLSYLVRDLLLLPRIDEADDVASRDDRDHKAPPPEPETKPAAPLVAYDADGEPTPAYRKAWEGIVGAQEYFVKQLKEGETIPPISDAGWKKISDAATANGWMPGSVTNEVGGRIAEPVHSQVGNRLLKLFATFAPEA